VSKGGEGLDRLNCPVPLPSGDRVLLGHGSGGRLSAELVRGIFLSAMPGKELTRLNDQAFVDVQGTRLAFTTDSFVVKPLFFPGGDIGSLAVFGTVNDLAVGGAKPLYLSVAFILEEGFPLNSLRKIAESIQKAASRCGVEIVTGDTKVVERGSADGVFINTTGIGLAPAEVSLSADKAQPGDFILLNGPIGDHGVAIMARREGLEFETTIRSDSAPLHTLVAALLEVDRERRPIHCLRDPTRGGLSSTLNEIAAQSHAGMMIEEEEIPIREEVKGACELLGLDPLYVANEGKLVAFVHPDSAEEVLEAMRDHPLGRGAQIIGAVSDQHPGIVTLKTRLGTERVVDMLAGDQLPRIC
jgi:hydrogenase expression/formation protein HypE